MNAQEWDWPPRRRGRHIARIKPVEIVVGRRPQRATRHRPTYRGERIAVGVAKSALSVPLALVAFGALWLLGAALSS